MKRRDTGAALLALGVLCIAKPGTAQAPKSGQPRRIGVLSLESESTAVSLRDLSARLRKLGWVDGDNLTIERAYADRKGERLAGLANELVSKRVELILSIGAQATLAATRATRTIPILFWSVGWPVERGFVDSLARPGRNVTGINAVGTEITTKRLQFLREIAPTARRLSWLRLPGQEETLAGGRFDLTALLKADASSLGFETRFHDIRPPEDVGPIFAEITAWHAQAITVSTSSRASGSLIAALALHHRLPSAFGNRRDVEAGGLLAYDPARSEIELLSFRFYEYVDRILRGARPADLPVEQAKKFELVINRTTATTLGLTIPPSLLQRADEVIQ